MIDAETFTERWRAILSELHLVFEGINVSSVQTLAEVIQSRKSIFISGQGRSGLVARAFANRLMHIGLPVHVVGDITTPAIHEGDLLLAVSSSGGRSTTVAHAETARKLGARLCIVTTTTVSRLTELAEISVFVPVGSGSVTSRQHAGSLFEQAVFLLFDSISALVQQNLGQSDAQLNARHANLQ